MLIKQDVEDANDEDVTALFVEAFGDKEKFFNVCLKEIEKAEAIIEAHMDRSNIQERDVADYRDDDEDIADELPGNKEDRIQVLFDLFKDKDMVTLTKYIKVFGQGSSQILGIAHAKLNADFNKAFKKLRLEPDDDDIKHVKSFTKPDGDQMSGKGTMKATSCKIFKMKSFSKNFHERVLNLFNMEIPENMSDDDDANDDQIAQSQDHPLHTQSRTTETLKVCSCCKFRSRDKSEYDEHMAEHPKCPQCGLHFKNETDLTDHHKAFHAKINCTKCGKLILENSLKKHMDGHMMEKGFKNVISKGRVKASSRANDKGGKSEGKEVKMNGYRIFLKTKRPEIKDNNPDANPREMIVLLNAEWNKEKIAGRKDFWERLAKEQNDVDSVNSVNDVGPIGGSVQAPGQFHEIQKCGLCGLMIANLNVHMSVAHKEVVVGNVEPAVANVEPVVTHGEPVVANVEPVVANVEPVVANVEPVDTNDEPVVTLDELVVANDETVVANVTKFKVDDIVMVQRKTLHWPGKVMGINNKWVEVMVYDKNRTVEKKHEKFVLPFSTDPSCCDGRGSVWTKAWKSAKAAYDMRR